MQHNCNFVAHSIKTVVWHSSPCNNKKVLQEHLNIRLLVSRARLSYPKRESLVKAVLACWNVHCLAVLAHSSVADAHVVCVVWFGVQTVDHKT